MRNTPVFVRISGRMCADMRDCADNLAVILDKSYNIVYNNMNSMFVLPMRKGALALSTASNSGTGSVVRALRETCFNIS